jgi:hypothetical protein
VTVARERAGRVRGYVFDLALLLVLKGAVGAFVLHAGFTHVSDDDYARVVIAQTFAHTPALDPSGTSWLPFPFWLTGGAMIVFGRSLEAARAMAFALGIVGVAFPYVAMRALRCGRATAVGALIVAMAIPWSAWLGVATVPEAMTACLIAAGAIAAGAPHARVFGAACLLAASWSRYEAWPACAVMALAAGLGAARGQRATSRHAWAALAVSVAGPLTWMAWNAHAHGSPLHFVHRVTAYRQAIGAASGSLAEKLTTFPLAVVATSPLIVGLAALGSLALLGDADLRARWVWPLASAAAILAFLVYGDVHDGAPTHHPERAVIPILWILAPFAADSVRALARRVAWARPAREMWVVGAGLAGTVAWSVTLPSRWRDYPASGADESREAQITRGLALATDAPTARFAVTPCAYEHFALIAAFAAPERVDVEPATHEPVRPSCPRVEPR